MNIMLSEGGVHFNPVCLHITAVSLHSRSHRQTGSEPQEQQQQQQLRQKKKVAVSIGHSEGGFECIRFSCKIQPNRHCDH